MTFYNKNDETHSVSQEFYSTHLSEPTPKICIIGAGISGMVAALTLSSFYPEATKPFITIFEGRSQLGGRLAQTTLPKTCHIVDLGPNWIHGTDHNPILELANKLGDTTHSFGEEGDADVFDAHGRKVIQNVVEEITDEVWSVIVQAFKKSRNGKDGNEVVDERESLKDFFMEILNKKYAHGDEKKLLVEQLARYWGAFVGANYDHQSMKYFWLEGSLDGENVFLASTYTKILAHVNSLVSSDPNITIEFNTTIDKIDYNHDGKVLSAKSACKTYSYDELIMTAPLGWLKRHHKTTFYPPLPDLTVKAIDEIGYGNLEKVFITFPSAWWDTPSKHPKKEGDRNAFSTFLSNEPNKIVQCISLSSLPTTCSHPTLLFYIFGDFARQLSRDLEGIVEVQEREKFILSQFQRDIELLPGYDSTRAECRAISTLYTNWQADELAGNGSYSNFQIPDKEGAGQALDDSIRCLRYGLPELNLWFAGEHTAPFVGLGTVTGAWWSGENVARRIGAKYGVCAEVVKEDEYKKDMHTEDEHNEASLKTHDAI